jgi:hypothetical protein
MTIRMPPKHVAVSRQTAILQQHENVASKPPAKIIGEAANTWLIATVSKLTIAATIAGLLLGAAIAGVGIKTDFPRTALHLAKQTLQPLW